MSRGLPSWAHPGVIIGLDNQDNTRRSHANFWLDKIGPRHWQWIGVNPLHGTYHNKAAWAVSVGGLPQRDALATRQHALFLLWGRPELRAGDPVSRDDVAAVEAALVDLARRPEARVDPVNHAMVPVLDVLFRAQHDGVHSWVSARFGDLFYPPRDGGPELAHLRARLADPARIAVWADSAGITWGKPAVHTAIPDLTAVARADHTGDATS